MGAGYHNDLDWKKNSLSGAGSTSLPILSFIQPSFMEAHKLQILFLVLRPVEEKGYSSHEGH